MLDHVSECDCALFVGIKNDDSVKVVRHDDHFSGIDLRELAGDGVPRLLECVAGCAVEGFAIDDSGEDFESVLDAECDEVGGVSSVVEAFESNATSMVDARVVKGGHAS